MDVRTIVLDESDNDEESLATFWGKMKFLEGLFKLVVTCLAIFETDEPILYKVQPELVRLQEELKEYCQNSPIWGDVQKILNARMEFLQTDTMLLGRLAFYKLSDDGYKFKYFIYSIQLTSLIRGTRETI